MRLSRMTPFVRKAPLLCRGISTDCTDVRPHSRRRNHWTIEAGPKSVPQPATMVRSAVRLITLYIYMLNVMSPLSTNIMDIEGRIVNHKIAKWEPLKTRTSEWQSYIYVYTYKLLCLFLEAIIYINTVLVINGEMSLKTPFMTILIYGARDRSGSDIDLLSDATKPLHEQMMTYHRWSFMAFDNKCALMLSFHKMSLNITLLKLQPRLLRDNGITLTFRHEIFNNYTSMYCGAEKLFIFYIILYFKTKFLNVIFSRYNLIDVRVTPLQIPVNNSSGVCWMAILWFKPLIYRHIIGAMRIVYRVSVNTMLSKKLNVLNMSENIQFSIDTLISFQLLFHHCNQLLGEPWYCYIFFNILS